MEEYALRMRKRGDTYSEMNKFLKAQWANEEQVNDAIKKVKELEKQKLLVIEPGKKTYSTTNLVMGGIVVLLGIFLTTVLWGKGWVSTLSLTMIGGGLIGMFKK